MAYGGGQFLLVHRAVADHHHFVKDIGALAHGDVQLPGSVHFF